MDDETAAGYKQLFWVVAFVLGSVILSVLLKITYTPPKQNGNGERVIAVDVLEVEPGPYQLTVRTSGVVEAKKIVDITPQVSGQIVRVNPAFATGGSFAANEVLFEIDKRDYKLEIDRLEAAIASAQTKLAIENAESKRAKAEYLEVHPGANIPPLVARLPQLAEAQANIVAAKAQLEVAKLNLARTDFSLPFNGRVSETNITAGQFISSGGVYGKVFDKDSIEISATVESKTLKWLTPEAILDISIVLEDTGVEEVLSGELRRSVANIDVQTRFAPIHIGFIDPAPNALPGNFAKVYIIGPKLGSAMTIPQTAVQPGGFIWTVDNKDKLHAIKPDILLTTEDNIVIQNQSPSLKVVTNRVLGGIEGMKVQAMTAKEDSL